MVTFAYFIYKTSGANLHYCINNLWVLDLVLYVSSKQLVNSASCHQIEHTGRAPGSGSVLW